ncbi:hypothetical protein MBANPS3_000753 [Mucor bainieri]
MQVYIKTAIATTILIDAKGSETIQDLKQKIQHKEEVPRLQQHLYLRNKELEDDQTSKFMYTTKAQNCRKLKRLNISRRTLKTQQVSLSTACVSSTQGSNSKTALSWLTVAFLTRKKSIWS